MLGRQQVTSPWKHQPAGTQHPPLTSKAGSYLRYVDFVSLNFRLESNKEEKEEICSTVIVTRETRQKSAIITRKSGGVGAAHERTLHPATNQPAE